MESQKIREVAENTYIIDSLYVRAGIGAIYLLLHEQKIFLVDCGTGHSVVEIEKAAQKLGTSLDNLETIFLTHVHLDHSAGAGLLMKKAKDAKIYVHPKGKRHIIDPSYLIAGASKFYGASIENLFGEVLSCPSERVIAVEDNALIDFYGRKLQVHFSIGHAKHHISLWDEKNKIYFAGDSAGICYENYCYDGKIFPLAPTSPTDFNPDAWKKTLRKIREKNPKKILVTHFGAVQEVEDLLSKMEICLEKLLSIALANRELAAGEERVKKIQADIADFYAEGLIAIHSSWKKADIIHWLEKDFHIAAQGLNHWLTSL